VPATQPPRALVVTPNRVDARLSLEFLAEHDIRATAYESLEQLNRGLPEDAGCIVIVEDALVESDLPGFREVLEWQPAWSDVPLVLVSGEGARLETLVERAFPNASNVTLLERPFNPMTFVSAVRVGLRARAKQLEVRDLLQKREEALQQRNDFLAMLAHELRNPLAPMRNAVYLMKKPNAGHALTAQSIEILERQITHMSRMVDDLLDVARLERGRIDLKKQRLDLSVAVAAAADACLALTRARGHRVEISLDGNPLAVEADPVRLEQLLTNLIVNAAKFMSDGGEIKLQTGRHAQMAFVRVIDGGIGIRPDMIEAMFSPFVQDDRTLARSAGGLGIGLSIARRVAELHGGSLHAYSEGINKGSTFEARFPLAKATAAEAPRARVTAQSHTPRRVLVVEDNDDIRESLRLVLADWGHEVMLAKTGDEGLEIALQQRPDVALIDIGLPGRSGYDVAHEIRAGSTGWSARVQLIAVTGYGQPSDRARALEAGFNDHLLKPVDPDVLNQVLAQSGRLVEAAGNENPSQPGRNGQVKTIPTSPA
jgi:signal transduction histidine kinase/ActR/RegA family two-component response regulator